MGWIPSRNINGQYGYINTETGLFRASLPDSNEEQTAQSDKYNKAVLITQSANEAKFDANDGKRRNHSSETDMKVVNVPIIAINPVGTFTNTYISQLAPYENSLEMTSPEFDILTTMSGIKPARELINLASRKRTFTGVPQRMKFNKSKEFKSELDWSPKSWFEEAGGWKNYTLTDIDALISHIPEYHEIERISKANGTWLKMPNGSTWKGDPRSWVLLMSKDGSKLSKTVYWHGDTNNYATALGEDVTPIENGTRVLWGSSEPHIARSYTNSDNKVVPIVLKADQSPFKKIDAEGRIWKSAYKKNGKYYDTNTFSLENLKNGEYLVIDNVIDTGGSWIPKMSKYHIPSLPNESYVDYLIRTLKGNDIIIGKNTIRKFLVGNNGNFNLLDPNVFRISIPIMTFSTYDRFSK